MNLKEKALKGVFWSAIQNWGFRVISFLVFITLARLLDPEAFGLVALASVFIAFVQIFIDQGFGQALVQRQDLQPDHLRSLLRALLERGAERPPGFRPGFRLEIPG